MKAPQADEAEFETVKDDSFFEERREKSNDLEEVKRANLDYQE